MPALRYTFDSDLDVQEQALIREALEKAFETGEILPCPCAVVEAFVYPTRKPDFQASLSCSCDVTRPLYSSTPDTE
jgi:hypothetical protein